MHDIFVDGKHLQLSLWDTAGQEEFDRLRSLSYSDTHVIMLCFSVDSPASLENVSLKWIPEIEERCPGVQIVLCALKCDLRDDEVTTSRLAKYNQVVIGYDEGLAVAKKVKAVRYVGKL